MIFRFWHGWTTPANADAYQRIVQQEVFEMIAAKKIEGYQGIDPSRRQSGDEIVFVNIMRFDSLDAVKLFVGEDYERSFVRPQARAVLKCFDERAQHYEHIRHIDYWGLECPKSAGPSSMWSTCRSATRAQSP